MLKVNVMLDNLQARDDVSCVLHELVQVRNLSALLKLVQQIHLQMAQLVRNAHI